MPHHICHCHRYVCVLFMASAMLPGSTTADGAGAWARVQSRPYSARESGSVSTRDSPTQACNACSISGLILDTGVLRSRMGWGRKQGAVW